MAIIRDLAHEGLVEFTGQAVDTLDQDRLAKITE